MKTTTQYSLNNPENYNLELNSSTEDILTKYNYLLSEYLFFIVENIKIKNDNFYKFIIWKSWLSPQINPWFGRMSLI